VGICFGHQIISIAMGGKCEAGTNGWEIGVYGNEVTEEGKKWWSDVSGQGRDDRVVRHLFSRRATLIDSSFSRWYDLLVSGIKKEKLIASTKTWYPIYHQISTCS